MSDRKLWVHAGVLVHVAAVAGCVLPPVQGPVSCPAGAHVQETEQGPLCVPDQAQPGPGRSEHLASSPRDPGAQQPGWPAEPSQAADPSLAAAEPPPPPPPGVESTPSMTEPPATGPGTRVHRTEDGSTLREEIGLASGVPHGPWLRRDNFGRLVDRGAFEMGWPTGEWAHWYGDGQLEHTCVFRRDGQLVVACNVYRSGKLAAVESYIDRRPWPARSAEDLRGVHAMTGLSERHGTWIQWDSRTGDKLSEGSYDHGKETGVWTRWSLAGHVRLKESYRNGQREGAYGEWHENGRPRQEGSYSAGRKHGAWTTWSESGEVAERVSYEMGIEHGSAERFHPSGTPKERGSYDNGKKTGLWETWHEDGSLRWRGEYVNGKPQGPWEIRDEDGRVGRGMYVDGMRQGEWEIQSPAGWEPGKDMRIERGHYERGQRHGVWVRLGPDGGKQSEGRYDGNRKVGRWRTWSQAGQMVADVGYHESGKLHGPFTRWHDNGVLAEQGEYVDGVKVGAWIARARDGAVLHRGSYRDGEKHGPWLERASAGATLHDRLYDRGTIIPRHSYEAHLGVGFLQAPGRDAAVPQVLSFDIALLREHRQDEGPHFFGYGVETMIEALEEGTISVAVGVPLRVGAVSSKRRRKGGFSHGAYAYAQVTPFLRFGEGALDPGVRLGLGITAPGASRFWLRSRGRPSKEELPFELLSVPFRVALAALNHVEVVYEHDQAHGAQAGVLFGFGL